MYGTLCIVSTPIGNYGDITYRAVETLKSVDIIICEEYKEAVRLLNKLEIKKELFSLNEHNEKDEASNIIQLLKSGKNAALISDCGTPLFSDPGRYLAELCYNNKINVVPVPGVNSLITALSVSALNIDRFYFYGWLSPKKEERRKELLKLKSMRELIALMETPYRLLPLLRDITSVFGENVFLVLAYNLTQSSEKIYRMNAGSLLKLAEEKKLKGEFVLLIENRNKLHF